MIVKGNDTATWEGPELAGPRSRQLLRSYGAVVAETRAADLLAGGQFNSAMYALAGHPRGESMWRDVLKDWKRDGQEVGIDDTEDPMEPWAVLMEVLMRSGFFGPVRKRQIELMLEKMAKEETRTSE